MEVEYSKVELVVIRVLLKRERINRCHYLPWCYQMIERLDNPPQWVLDMGYASTAEEAQGILHRFIYREGPIGRIPCETDLEIAVLYLEQKAGKISWSDFLLEIGQLSDRSEGRTECSWFFGLLNEFEAVSGIAAYREKRRQQKKIKELYQQEITQIQEKVQLFSRYFDVSIR